jgi:predicted  nucleic acid-binding Zn-ribbon protein
MPPVNTSASSADVDNEATAELPVLDVAAYESTLETIAHTDSWVVPSVAGSQESDATAMMPVAKSEAIPTLRSAEPGVHDLLDLSGTHEMPALPQSATPHVAKSGKGKANKITMATAVPAAAAATAVPAPVARPHTAAAPIVLPPSPPLIEELRNALAAAERRIEELNERERIGDAERSVAIARANAESSQLREQLGASLEALHTAHERLGVQSAEQPELEDRLFASGVRIAALESDCASHTRMIAAKNTLLNSAQERCARLEADIANLRATVARRDAQIGMLEADLMARQQRETSMGARLTDALAATDPHVPHLRSEIVSLGEQIRTLNAELRAAQTRAGEKDEDLQVAEESIRNLEIEVRDKTGKLAEANVTVEEWRAVIAESQRSILQRDSRIQQLESDLEKRVATPVPVDTSSNTGEEVTLEGPARVLIRTDGNTDFVHVLSRRTRIGRGPDNELVLDTKHISRYHAVLLAGPVHTSIEDLNSTNGVFVNGKRIARQVLKDGDRVTVGRTQFRYTVRS